MKVISSVSYSIVEIDGVIKYRLDKGFTYYSQRYGKHVTLENGYISDGATSAMDITSRSWWVHDKLCDQGTWDDGTLLSNWQCSQVLQDIMVEESPTNGWERYRPSSRYWQSKRWFWATWLCGGGQARKNGMFKVAAAMLVLCALNGCSTITNNFHGSHNTLVIEQPKTVTATPYVSASGNTVPVSAIP